MGRPKKVAPQATPQINDESVRPINKKDIIGKIMKKKPKEKFLTENQRKYFESLFVQDLHIKFQALAHGNFQADPKQTHQKKANH